MLSDERKQEHKTQMLYSTSSCHLLQVRHFGSRAKLEIIPRQLYYQYSQVDPNPLSLEGAGSPPGCVQCNNLKRIIAQLSALKRVRSKSFSCLALRIASPNQAPLIALTQRPRPEMVALLQLTVRRRTYSSMCWITTSLCHA